MTQAADPRLHPLRDALSGMVLRGSANVSYHLRERIGEGGQGWVFRANWDDPAGHVVIVKVLRPDVVAGESLQRFQREAEVLRMLGAQGRPNPYIVRFYDHAIAQVPLPTGEEVGLPFTVLEFVDGTNLEQVLAGQKGQGLSADRARRLLRQITQALDLVHAQKVVHRDLKPSNILLANEGGTEVAKVTDFGLVKLVDVNLQRTTALAGASLGYAPPEQYEKGNQRVSERTDVFSLAAVVYEMLTGAAAFPFLDGENPFLVLTRILNGPRPSLARSSGRLAPELATQPALVAALAREIERALSADPAARHPSALAFWDAIEPSLRAAAQSANAEISILPRSVSAFDATAQHVARIPEEVAQKRASWAWSRLTPSIAPGVIASAAFLAGGKEAVALASGALLRWERNAWKPLPPLRISPNATVRGILPLADGSVLFYGTGGLVGRFFRDGRTEGFSVGASDIVFHGAVGDAAALTLVGERPSRGRAGGTSGVVVQLDHGKVADVVEVPTAPRLRGVARVEGGAVVACGDRGVLVRIAGGAAEPRGPVCKGDLFHVAALASGAVAVGAGGHALSLSTALEATLEPVHTTRDLLALAVDDEGQAWAGSVKGRVLRRSLVDGRPSWLRMDNEALGSASVTALRATMHEVRAMGDDGAVVSATLA